MLLQDKILKRSLFAPGRKIFSQGDTGDAAYVVESGRIAIYKHIGDKKIHLATISKGALFGEMAVIDGTDRMASAVALESSVVIAIPRHLVDQKMQKVDPFMKALIMILMENLRNVHKVYAAKPRSVHDYTKILDGFVGAIRQYSAVVDSEERTVDMENRINKVVELISEMKTIAEKIPERRDNAFPDDAQLPD